MQSSELYIGNLDPDVKSAELRELFQMYGNVIRSEVKIPDKTHAASYGFIGYESAADAEFAKKQMNGHILRQRRMIVQFSKNKPGRNRQRDRSISSERRETRINNKRDRSRHRHRQRSSSYDSQSKRDRNKSHDHRSRSSSNEKLSSKKLRRSSKDNQHHTSNHHRNSTTR